MPALFICEDNKYSVYSPLNVRQPQNRNTLDIVKKMGIKTIEGDGNNVIEVLNIYKKAKNYIIKKRKPFFIKFNTYRYLEHCGPYNDDNLKYRPKKELDFWSNRCPIKIFSKYILSRKILNTKQISSLEELIESKVLNYYKKSQRFPKPNFKKIEKLIYAK